jgi:hypothetical protein
MLAGAAMLIADLGPGIGLPLVAVGIAITAILEANRRWTQGPAQ